MVKTEEAKGTRKEIQWTFSVGAVIALLFSISITSRSYWTFSRLNWSEINCNCSKYIKGEQEFEGIVEDCGCDYHAVNSVNEELLYPLLQELVKTAFFRYFKVKLWCDCPFWPEHGICSKRDCCPRRPEAVVDRNIDTKAFGGWMEVDNLWTYDDETDDAGMSYVNLQLNPETYTGYTGPSARKIWDAIYTENCSKYASGDSCPEKRFLYKLISGLHSSISTEIAAKYPLDEERNTWGQNLTLMHERFLRHPDRIGNTCLFVLRAVTKAADYLKEAKYETGNPEDDLKAQFILRKLLYNPKLQAACPVPFNEAMLWKGESGSELKDQTPRQFRNISALMDCVGCEKCRLWGKLEILGLGTALKILFSVNGLQNQTALQLQRNEVIALINLLNQLPESIKFIHERWELQRQNSGRRNDFSN